MGQMTRGKSYKNVNAASKQAVFPLTIAKECGTGVLMGGGRCSKWDSVGGFGDRLKDRSHL